MPKVYNKRNKDAPPDAIYVGRPTRWGNPFKMDGVQSRDEVVESYRKYIHERPEFIRQVRESLRGKDLVCWCSPLACHADVLLEIANDLV